jgi:hypothetical protein
MVAGRRAGLRLEEVVVDDVERRDAEGYACEADLGEKGCRGRGSPSRLRSRVGDGRH